MVLNRSKISTVDYHNRRTVLITYNRIDTTYPDVRMCCLLQLL